MREVKGASRPDMEKAVAREAHHTAEDVALEEFPAKGADPLAEVVEASIMAAGPLRLPD